ncbi:Dual specificity protein phosphatase 9 [Smittium mucronatum]|uniref:protein-tyrosine-phosphatase n=1 Tax=Smittium mucronatum TaxID=133383 RepID=A0A1R0GRR8_9FUNG|nr:Dual specificity protein phosphatase 9 [Smittium mucronatum]
MSVPPKLNIQIGNELEIIYPTQNNGDFTAVPTDNYNVFMRVHGFNKNLHNLSPNISINDSQKLSSLSISELESPESVVCPDDTYPSKIIKNLYLGSEVHAYDGKILLDLNIGYVLNVARHDTENTKLESDIFFGHSKTNFKNDKYTEKQLKKLKNIEHKDYFWDHNQSNIINEFSSCFEFIDNAVSNNIPILVHCQLGVSRSATLIIAYIMHQKRISFNSAYSFVKLKSPKTSPNLSLIMQLLEYEKYTIS